MCRHLVGMSKQTMLSLRQIFFRSFRQPFYPPQSTYTTPWKQKFGSPKVMEVWFKWFSCSKGWLFGSCYFSEKYELKWGKKQRCRHWSTQILQFCPWRVVFFYNEKDLQRSQTNRVLIVCMAQTRTRQTSLQVILELQRSTVNCLRRNSSDTIFHPGYWSNTWELCNPVISWQGL